VSSRGGKKVEEVSLLLLLLYFGMLLVLLLMLSLLLLLLWMMQQPRPEMARIAQEQDLDHHRHFLVLSSDRGRFISQSLEEEE
jgi:hypothetical protein